MENVNSFKYVNEDGKEIVCDILFTFDSDETKKSYIVYTDNSRDAEGNVQVFASIYSPNDEKLKLSPIETEQEWKIIETILNTLQEEINKKSEETNNGEEKSEKTNNGKEKAKQTNNETNNPKTADNVDDIMISAMLFIVSITVMAILTVVNRKKLRK